MSKTPQKVFQPLGVKKLSKREMEFMEVIWSHPEGISSEELYGHFGQAFGTKTTVLHRISEKGLVKAVKRGRHYIYTPAVSKKDYIQGFFFEKLEREFGTTSFDSLAAAYCGRTELKPEEKEKVVRLLEELQEG